MVLPQDSLNLVLIDKVFRCTRIIDVACVMDHHVIGQKIEKHSDLKIELKSQRNTKVEIVPLVWFLVLWVPYM